MRIAATVTVMVIAMVTPATALSISADREVRQGSTALTWLANPAHAHIGSRQARRRVQRRSLHHVMHGLDRVGWLAPALCVHRYEGSWNDTRNPVDDGGMQLDSSFQSSYGAPFVRMWGRAYNWPPWAQLVTAYEGWKSRGWWPWPNTARLCGLL